MSDVYISLILYKKKDVSGAKNRIMQCLFGDLLLTAPEDNQRHIMGGSFRSGMRGYLKRE
jgi:hypothetical protein